MDSSTEASAFLEGLCHSFSEHSDTLDFDAPLPEDVPKNFWKGAVKYGLERTLKSVICGSRITLTLLFPRIYLNGGGAVNYGFVFALKSAI